MSSDLNKKIDNWRKKLLDLSKRNRLISFKATKTKSLPLQNSGISHIEGLSAGDEIYIRKSEKEIEEENEEGEIVEKTVDIKMEDVEDNEFLPTRGLEESVNSLDYLRQKKNYFEREKGVETFYLAVSFLEWFESPSSEEKIESPLILLPIEIEQQINRRKNRHNYKISYEGGEAFVNPALKKKLEDEFGLELPEDEEISRENLKESLSEIEDLVTGGLDRAKVENRFVLGIFDFQRVSLYNDLEENREAIKEDAIVKALNDDYSDIDDDVDIPSQDELDDEIDPEDTYQVVDADPSQQVAIEAAKSGKSFVLEGPPGTGKSQTITNIIAEKLAEGEKVLFVSQKKAALEVVKNNLDEVGLGRFCLDVHEGNKKNTLQQIEEEMKNNETVRSDSGQSLEQLKLKKERLNKYGDIIGKKFGKIGKTPYEAIGKVAKREDSHVYGLEVNDIFTVSENEVEEVKNHLRQLEDYGSEIRRFDNHTWKQVEIGSWGMKTRKRMESSIKGQIDALNDIQELKQRIGELGVSVDSVKDLRKFNEFLEFIEKCPIEPESSLLSEKLLDEEGHIRKLESLEKDRKELLENLEKNYEEIPEVDADELEDSMEDTGFIGRKISGEYKESKKKILGTSREGYNPDHSQLMEDLEKLEDLEEINEDIAERKQVQRLLGKLYNGRDTDWDNVEDFLDWLHKYFQKESRTEEVQDLISNEKEVLEQLSHRIEEKLDRFDEEKQFFQKSMKYGQLRYEGSQIEKVKIREHIEFLETFQKSLDELKPWINFQRRLESLKNTVGENFVEKFLEGDNKPELLTESFVKSFYTDFLDQIFKETDLDEFSSREMETVLDEFRNLDKKQQEIARDEVVQRITSNRPDYQRQIGENGGVAHLKREIQKDTKHKALRKTFRKSANVITDLKPCFMMSPLSVAKNLEKGSIEFDTVIFDEASQVEPETAISSLIRADQAIIVGDTKQLPPTDFFRADVEDDEDVREDLESILDETSTALPKEQLMWHYRSRDNELIEFSNHHYYGNRLKTFPGNNAELDTGAEFEYVEDGMYDRGGSSKNEKEAERVVDLIEKHAEDKPEKSLGVVAFSSSQREAIEDELYLRKQKNAKLQKFASEDKLEDFFVKSLENVQGDQRDVMIFGIGYGPDENGKITMNFGPLNRKGGERRLNVAVTRAKEKVIVVTSMQPGELDASRTSSKGPKHFKKYLEYAKNGDQVLERDISANDQEEFDSEFEEAVYTTLQEEGLNVTTQVQSSGYSIDLAVKHPEKPGKYILGIECDGAAYHSTKTARERDRLRQSVLEDLGWNIHRIWSTDWIRNEEREIEKIKDKIGQIKSRS
jgi:superfamily I DNA and/or RNA helicase